MKLAGSPKFVESNACQNSRVNFSSELRYFKSQRPRYKKNDNLCVCLCVCVCVCMCVCVYFLLPERLLLTEQKTNVMAEFRSAMICCGNISVSSTKYLSSHQVIGNHNRNLQASNCAKRVSIKLGRAIRSKRQLL